MAEGQACTFTVIGTDVNVRTGATAASPAVQKLNQGDTVVATTTVDQRVPPDGGRRLGAGHVADPRSGHRMHLMAR